MELEYAPEPEAPTRFAKVLLALGSGIALAYDRKRVSSQELRLILRVALDCLPVIRRRVITALVDGAIEADTEGELPTTKIAGMARCSTTAIRRALEDLEALNVVICHKAGTGKADRWELEGPWADLFQGLTREVAGDGVVSDGDDQDAGECDAPPDISGTPPGTFPEMSAPPAHARADDVEEGLL